MRSWQKLHPCPAEPLPPGSKMNVLLVKAGPIKNSGNTFVIIKTGKEKWIRRSMEKYTVNTSFIACNVCSAGFGGQLSTVLLCGLRSGCKSLLRVTMFHSLCTDLNTGYVRQQTQTQVWVIQVLSRLCFRCRKFLCSGQMILSPLSSCST